ncbi:MAG: heme NO-binding domain-containing protein [Sedimentitalea sp.]
MHGLINSAIQSFVCHTYGRDRWVKMAQRSELGFVDYEAMLVYDDDQSRAVLKVICEDLARPEADVLEDLGTFLVSHPEITSVRRLLRFSGTTFVDFINSLDDLPDRVRLAVSDLILPPLELRELTTGLFSLKCGPGLAGYGRVMVGILRAMADEYGALVMLDHTGTPGKHEEISIALIETAFAEGRNFELGAGAK